MSSLVERTRYRLVTAVLTDLQDKTGSYITPVKLSDGSVTTVELDADILAKALKKLFEARVYDINKRVEAEKEIAGVYSDSVNVKHGKLTNKGQLLSGRLLRIWLNRLLLKEDVNNGQENIR